MLMTRREVLRLGAMGAASIALPASADESSFLYFMDGYHGGIRGHMPDGSFRDILSALREYPSWKLSLDVEPSSWSVLELRDPEAFQELVSYLVPSSHARVEMVAGTFSQPYGWALSGESNIRQMQRGLQVIGQSFPEVRVVSYAVQEPCWSSCLPQILRSLGLTGVSLKNASTAWGGYTAGFDAAVVNWIGPDGTSIAAVPRYQCEDLQAVFATESVDATEAFARKCLNHGIDPPAGMCFQDLGWAAKPQVSGSYVRFATWKEYFAIASPTATKDWRVSIEDFLVTLPWGQPALRKVAQQVRAAEVRLVHAEKLCALAFCIAHFAWPAETLQASWDDVMLSQSHDAWICATTREGRQAQEFQVAYHTLEAQENAETLMAEAAQAIARGPARNPAVPLGAQSVCVFNSLGCERTEPVTLTLAADPGTVRFEVADATGTPVPSQFVAERRYHSAETLHTLSETHASAPEDIDLPDQPSGINTARLTFRARVPAAGYSTYRVKPVYASQPGKAVNATGPVATNLENGVWTVETDLYRITLNPALGGAITSLLMKEASNLELCASSSPFLFNEYRGYFIEQKAWRSSRSSLASIDLVEKGPVRVILRIRGSVGDVPYETHLSLAQGQRNIEFRVRFNFTADTYIGEPIDIAPNQRELQGRRSQNDGRWKLQAMFPNALAHASLYKNAAFDVCRSRNTETFFKDWNDIKHNIIVDWVDLFDEKNDVGMALLSDHTTAYNWGPDHPLSLVLGWAWDGGFWWDKRPLRGEQTIAYSIVPHLHAWDSAGIWQQSDRWAQPLTAQIVQGDPSSVKESASLVQIDGEELELSTMQIEAGHLIVRLFNARSERKQHSLSFGSMVRSVRGVGLDGKPGPLFSLVDAQNGRKRAVVEVRRFGLITLQCALS